MRCYIDVLMIIRILMVFKEFYIISIILEKWKRLQKQMISYAF